LGARIASAGADGVAFPNELFVMRAVDADGSFRSELGETEQWAGKVKAVTEALSREVGVLKEQMSKIEQQNNVLKEEIQQQNNVQNKQTEKLDQLLMAVALLANEPPSQ
jgi:seryl-tRNA synthetase